LNKNEFLLMINFIIIYKKLGLGLGLGLGPTPSPTPTTTPNPQKEEKKMSFQNILNRREGKKIQIFRIILKKGE